MHIIAFLEPCRCLGVDGPGASGLESCRPKNHAKISPDCWILVGEHHQLHAIVWHVPSEVLVDLHHRTAEVFAIAAYRKFSSGIGDPFWKGFGQLLVIPRKEEVPKFVVIDCISIGRISDPEVTGFAKISSVRGRYRKA